MRRLKRFSRKYIAAGAAGRRRFKLSRPLIHPIKGHPFIVPVLTFLVLFFVTTVGLVVGNAQTIGATDYKVVDLSVDGQVQTVPTRANTVRDLLKKLSIEVNTKDLVTPSLDTQILEDNTHIDVQRARPVTIIDNGQVTTVLSPHRQPRTIVESAGIKLYPEDGIQTEAPTEAPNKQTIIGDQIVVDRAKPATVNLYGNGFAVRTRAKTVGDLLEQKDIKTIPGDTVQPDPSTPITPNIQVFVVSNGKKVQTVEEAIPSPVENVNDPTLALGVATVSQAGSPGKKLVTYELDLKNGNEVNRRELQEIIATNPVKRVVTHGTKVVLTGSRSDWLSAAGISPNEYYAVDYIVGRESGWCPTKWQGEYGNCRAYHGAPSSGGVGYGLCQATPGYKMSSFGIDWAVNPVTQLKWCTNYAVTRYGSWSGAYQFWSLNHWW